MFLTITDSLGNLIQLPSVPKKIISLVPSLTELLYTLGLDEEVTGITKFCVHPQEWFRSKQRTGGTKTVNISRVISLQPDLIIANKEENVKEQIEELQKVAPVYTTDINNFGDALDAIVNIGKLTGKQEEANELVGKISVAFDAIVPLENPVATIYLIWKDPYMAAGGNTFINDMLARCGLQNMFKNISRYPEVNMNSLSSVNDQLSTSSPSSVNERLSTSSSPSFVNEQLSTSSSPSSVNDQLSTSSLSSVNERLSTSSSSSVNDQLSTFSSASTSSSCQLLLLSSEPYPFKMQHVEELQRQLPGCKIRLVDGEMFSWYGSRLLQAAPYFKNLLTEIQQEMET